MTPAKIYKNPTQNYIIHANYLNSINVRCEE